MRRERAARRRVDEVEAVEQAAPAQVARDRVSRLDLAQARLELGAAGGDVLEHAVLLDVVDHGEPAGGGDGVGRERVAGLVLDAVGGAAPEGRADVLRQQDGGERRVAAREALADAEDVRPDAGLLGGEPGSEPAEPGHDLVEDQEHARLVAERAQPAQVVVREPWTPAVSITGSTITADTVRGPSSSITSRSCARQPSVQEPVQARHDPGIGGCTRRPPRDERLVRRPQLRPARRR